MQFEYQIRKMLMISNGHLNRLDQESPFYFSSFLKLFMDVCRLDNKFLKHFKFFLSIQLLMVDIVAYDGIW